MTLLCWNCRGLGNPRAVQMLQRLVRKEDPVLVFLMETKLDAHAAEGIRCRLSMQGCLSVERDGLAGGLALLWKHGVVVSVKSFSKGHIDAWVESGVGEAPWRFTGFYGNPEVSKRKDSWELLRRLYNLSPTLPWVCAGDSNEILFSHEKCGMNDRSPSQMDEFRKVVDDVALSDMGYNGPKFTWCNNRWNGGFTRVRLDRGLINDSARDIFPSVEVHHLVNSSSDHLPMSIDLLGTKREYRRRGKAIIYHFEKMWLRDTSCEGIVQAGWAAENAVTTLGDIKQCIENVSSRLTMWNKETFGHVQRSLNCKTQRLQELLSANILDQAAGEEVVRIQKEIEELLERESALWSQRARTN